MELSDLNRPTKLYVVDDARRSWRTLWLLKRERSRLIFAGYMTDAQYSSNLNGPTSLIVSLVDAASRLQYTTIYPDSQEPEKPRKGEA